MRLFCLTMVFLPLYFCLLEEEWLDPNDPSPRKQLATVHELEQYQIAESCADDPSLRLILNRMFQRINVDPSQRVFFTRKAKLSLSSYSMAVIADYLESETANNEVSKRELVRSALHNMIEVLPEDDTTFIQSVFTFLWPWIVMCNMVIIPPAVFFVLRSIMTTRSFWLSVLTIIILLSMITTYNRMYQEKIAARLAAATEMKGDACAPAGLIEQGLDFLSGLVTLRKKSSCLKFIESQTVSIVSEISLLDVFTDVLSNGLFGWLSSLGPHLNKFYRGLCEDIPLPYLVLVFGSMILLFVRISTPIFTIEPLMITLLGNVCSTVVHGLTANEHVPIRPAPLPSREHTVAIRGTSEKYPNVTQRTPESFRTRRLQERKRHEKMKVKTRDESDLTESDGSSELRRRDRSISRRREDF